MPAHGSRQANSSNAPPNTPHPQPPKRSSSTGLDYCSKNLAALQQLLDEYRQEYNNRRHQSLDGQTPQQRYDARPKATPATGPHRPSGVTTRPVSATGVIAFSGCSIVLGRTWAGHAATVYWQGDRVTVMVDDMVARQLTLDRSVRYQRLTNQKLSGKS
ncbi:hypothetical protein OG738_14570 [Amycolatopsis sp. NBC_01488]|uniref:hypothetical protein n=1 Tax=Amycolatopsis sp. NBC_01488 TaxID=2903563 RepID=UPI002E2E05E1|nr:hypothetical protein [Amycolatopsis sp. NBC_01488]